MTARTATARKSRTGQYPDAEPPVPGCPTLALKNIAFMLGITTQRLAQRMPKMQAEDGFPKPIQNWSGHPRWRRNEVNEFLGLPPEDVSEPPATYDYDALLARRNAEIEAGGSSQREVASAVRDRTPPGAREREDMA